MRRRIGGAWVGLAVGCVILLCPPPAEGQFVFSGPQEATWAPSSDLIALGGGVIGSLALVLADDEIRGFFQSRSAQRSGVLRTLSHRAEPFGSQTPQLVSLGAALAGRVSGWGDLDRAGRRIGGGIAVSAAASALLKSAIGRARPRTSEGDERRFFHRGAFVSGSGLHSFPSGHTTTAFALATGISQEAGRRWPGASRYVTPTAYGVATLVGLSRIYDDKHWASDVLMGAVLGTVTTRLWIRTIDRLGAGSDAGRFTPTVIRGFDGATGLGLQVRVR